MTAAIRLGEILLEARTLHPGDREFGRWCSAKLALRGNSVLRAMHLAQHFAERPEAIEVTRFLEAGAWGAGARIRRPVPRSANRTPSARGNSPPIGKPPRDARRANTF